MRIGTRAILVFPVALALLSTQARAQQVVANGTTVTVNGGSVNTNASGSSGFALWALNSGVITTTAPVSISTTGSGANGVVAQSGGTITLFKGTTIYPNAPGTHSLFATGAGSVITADGITTASNGTSSDALVATAGGTINLLTGSTIYANGSSSFGAYSSGGSMTISGSSLTTSGTADNVIDADSGGSITLLNGTMITANQNDSYGLFDTGSGSKITSLGTIIRINGSNDGGAAAEFGATLSLTGGSITTGNSNAYGLLTLGSGASLSANGVTIMTTGTNSQGTLIEGATSMELAGTTLLTQGSAAAAIFSQAFDTAGVGTISVSNSSLTSNQSYGAYVTGTELDATLANSSIKGVNLLGVVNYGTLNLVADQSSQLTGAAITQVGSTSNMWLLNGSTWHMNGNSNLTNLTLDRGTLEFDANNLSLLDTNPIALNPQGGAIDSNGFNGTILSPFTGAGSLIKTGTGIVTLTGANSNYSGATFIEAGTLQAGATNVLSPNSEMNVGPNGTLDLAGFSQTVAALNDAGVVNFGTATPVGTILTVSGNYFGYGGKIIFNTILGDDNSTTDVMIVKGNTAGNTYLDVVNAGGSGAATFGNGILLIQVDGLSSGIFTLEDRVAAGAYEYNLFQGGVGTDPNGNWYLRTDAATPEPSAPPPTEPPPTEPPFPTPTIPPSPAPTDPPLMTPSPVPTTAPSSEPPAPTTSPDPSISPEPTAPPTSTPEPTASPEEPESVITPLPDYRVEVPTDMAAQALASMYGLTVLGTFHDRTSGYVADSRAWARVLGISGSVGYNGTDMGGRLVDFQQFGPSYNYYASGIELGEDLYRQTNDDSSAEAGGLYVGIGNAGAQVQTVYSTSTAGTTTLNGYTLGLYLTHQWPKGAYLDGVGQFTWYQNIRAVSSLGQNLHSVGGAYAFSMEGGATPFALGHGYILEPQAQLIYQDITLLSGADQYGLITFDPNSALYARLGLRLAKTWSSDNRPLSGWLRVNVWDSFNAVANTTFADLDGESPVTLPTSLGGSWLQGGLGITKELSSHTSIFFTGNYQHGLGQATSNAVSGYLGVKVSW
jgi:outer membrane autotransporter protein